MSSVLFIISGFLEEFLERRNRDFRLNDVRDGSAASQEQSRWCIVFCSVIHVLLFRHLKTVSSFKVPSRKW